MTIYGEYSQRITGAPRSNETSLDSLTVNGEAVSPALGSGRAYTALISYTGSSGVPVLGTAAGKTVTYKIGGTSADGVYGSAHTLTLGEGASETVYVRVTAANGLTSDTYTVKVTRTRQVGIIIKAPNTEPVRITASGSTASGIPSISRAAGASVTFTVTGDYDDGSLKWWVNDTEKSETENSLTINARDYAVKTHNLTVQISSGGKLYSQEVQFSVGK
jgi:hypothetical protein